jgi:UDP-N-acetylglucosamine acyltransferase
MAIHPTAIVHPEAIIGENVEIGPYSVIEKDVKIGDNCSIDAHVKISRYTTMGDRCRVYFGALVGEEPQDHRFYPGIVSYTEIGSDTVIREYVTIHRPPFEEQKTVIGNHCLLMGFVHIAHDVVLADHVTIANNTILAGHIHVEDGAVISGHVLIHQFCKIGKLAMVGPGIKITQDVPPFCLVGDKGVVFGPNVVGLRRAGLTSDQRNAIRNAIKTLFFKGLNTKNACTEIEAGVSTPEVEHFIAFIKASTRGILPGKESKK